jgi:hypothetical protein
MILAAPEWASKSRPRRDDRNLEGRCGRRFSGPIRKRLHRKMSGNSMRFVLRMDMLSIIVSIGASPH